MTSVKAPALTRRPSQQDLDEIKQSEADDVYTQQVLKREIHWKQYADSGFISNQELGLLLDYDSASNEEEQDDLLQEKGPEYASVYLKALSMIREPDTVQYLLAIVDNLLSAEPRRARYFYAVNRDAYAPFLSILKRRDESQFTVNKAVHVLAVLFSESHGESAAELSEYLHWILEQAVGSKGRELLAHLGAIKDLLKSVAVQKQFVDAGGLKTVIAIMAREASNTQVLYIGGFIIWLLTFNKEVYPDLHENLVVRKLVDVTRNVLREKVVRIAVAAFKNLLNQDTFNEDMIYSGLPKVLTTLRGRKWKDEDLKKDVVAVDEVLQTSLRVLSSFEKYKTELLSGDLAWTPVHTERFWRENVNKFDEKGFSLVRQLIQLLQSESNTVVEVACYDLGEFARFHPDGKLYIQKFGGKPPLMRAMSHKDAKVKKQALLAVQKLMITNWEYLQKGGRS